MPVLFLAIALVAGLLAFTRSHPLLSMTNDRSDYSVFPKPNPQFHGPLLGHVVLGNNGLLPYTYLVSVPDSRDGLHLEVRTHKEHRLLYSGPPPTEPVELGNLDPGQRAILDVELSSSTGLQPSPVSFSWTARAAPSPLLVIGVLLVVGIALLALLYVGGVFGPVRISFGSPARQPAPAPDSRA